MYKIAYFIYEKSSKENKWMKFVERFSNFFSISQITPQDIIQNDCLSQFDLLFVGGGMPAEHDAQLTPEGVSKIKQFLQQHKGVYVGSCAGAYNALPFYEPMKDFNPSWSLLDSSSITLSDADNHHWKRGVADVPIKIVDANLLPANSETLPCMYQNGPLLKILDPQLMISLGTFTTEVAQFPDCAKEVMSGSDALVANRQLNVVLFSPHPEFSTFEWVKPIVHLFRSCIKKQKEQIQSA